MAEVQHVEVSPEQLASAQKMWNGFITLSKYSIGFIIAVLVTMALFLL